MQILLCSDLAGKVPNVQEDHLADSNFVLIAGDVTLGAKSVNRATKNFLKLGAKFSPPMPVFFIPGNHDYPILSVDQDFYPQNFIQMHNRSSIFEVEGFERKIIVIGYGGAKMGLYNNFAFTEAEIYDSLKNLFDDARAVENLDEYFTILLIHDPPNETKLDMATMGGHVGSVSVRKIIEEFQPNLAVAGHIHESLGIDKIGHTIVVNAGEAKYQHYALIQVGNMEDGENCCTVVSLKTGVKKSKKIL